jgi:octopine/nopaline transport system substrate-binding protein
LLGKGAGIAVRKTDSGLKEKFDEAITQAKTDGTIKRLSEKHFGFDITPR